MKRQLCVISGGSKGLGKALVEAYLIQDFDVVNIARSSSGIRHPALSEIHFDLSTIQANSSTLKAQLDAIWSQSYQKITLINNAAGLGEIKAIKDYAGDYAAATIALNLSAPFLLTTWFLTATAEQGAECTIFNVSSGAAKHAIPGWGLYCSTKAGLDMLSAVTAVENPQVKVASVNPGIMDTPMQEQIRSSNEQDFPLVANFRHYKDNKLLVPAKTIADLLLKADLAADFESGRVLQLEDRFEAPRKQS
jgi:benzil reductase ((S)-benzoin forming)